MTLDVYMIGGANGAGKTTGALDLLPKFIDTYEFVNADEIARGLNPIMPETANLMAGRAMIKRIDGLIHSRKSFAFETTCAGRHHQNTLQKCKEAGYGLHLIFLWLPSVEMAIERVAHRVAQGGHLVSEETIRRRYTEGFKNLFSIWLPIVDTALILKGVNSYPVIAEKIGDTLKVTDHALWQQIESISS